MTEMSFMNTLFSKTVLFFLAKFLFIVIVVASSLILNAYES